MRVTKEHRTKWGSYNDRKNSFDDKKDIETFFNMIQKDESLKKYITSFLPETPDHLRKHPNGKYGVDIGIVCKNNIIGTIDIERWKSWNPEWPDYYKHIHFLARKEKFLKQSNKPFFMANMNFDRTKVLMISRNDIEKYPTIEKYFHHKGVSDIVRELKISDGVLFGEGITEKERSIFK